ncbi:M17 family metallopeptidase [Fretibacter rubidus]|uniref:leucyl aminopeptidase family protein n=1 Tax=Fretibacter rubidus TaxID=570162 RepID=UPI00352B36E6
MAHPKSVTCFTTRKDFDRSHDGNPLPVHVCRPDGWDAVRASLSATQQAFADARGFRGDTGQRIRLPGNDGHFTAVLFGAGPVDGDVLGPIRLGQLATFLSGGGVYELITMPDDWTSAQAAVGWGLGAYKFDRYLPEKYTPAILVLDAAHRPDETIALVSAVHFGRDLVNTPAADMGPVALHDAAIAVAEKHGAEISAIIGDDLLDQNYPMIHAVGRAAHEAPRLVEFQWGDPTHPTLAIIGKGITFDTGGLNIKGASGARIMKKDMGGAAHALALADMIMGCGLPVRLHVLVSIAENAISANAYRPGDILTSRTGLTVEIDNTDAEGRLVLGDALCKAAEAEPDLMIDFATLTGAARVALGPTLPPFFSNRKAPVAAILEKADSQHDPLWHMPLWQPYNSLLSSPIADMKNAGGSFAGSVTAALFLERFVKGRPWMHLDVYAWNPTSQPAHPAGGDMFALRAIFHWLKAGGLNGDFSQ